jgi:hypothetical protein
MYSISIIVHRKIWLPIQCTQEPTIFCRLYCFYRSDSYTLGGFFEENSFFVIRLYDVDSI